jgi:hypothetical protein
MTRPKIEDSILKDTSSTILMRIEIKNIVKAKRNNLIIGVVMAILCVESIFLALEPPSPIYGSVAAIFGIISYLYIRGSRLNSRVLKKAYHLTKENK